ncbi:MAG: hypothetical protein NTY72_01390 [Bacteroidetes bacterium]|nr:hypothetical protein [Bacteroidota bacterium]
MNLSKLLLCILTFTVIIMVSCQKEQLDRKDQLENQTNAIERQQSHNAIDAITKQYSSMTFSSKTKFDEVVKLLDFDDVSVVLRPSLSALILIHLNKNDADSRKRYLAVSFPNSKSDNFYHFEGIYSSKDLSFIKQAITTNRIEKGNIVTLRLLNQKPLKEWDASGTNTVARIAIPKSLLTPRQFAMVKGGIQSITTNSVQEPKVNLVNVVTACIDYYWVEYDAETGEIYSTTYLYQDCTDYGGGGGGDGGEEYYNSDVYRTKTFFDARPAGTGDNAPKVIGQADFQGAVGLFRSIIVNSMIPNIPSDTYWIYTQTSITNHFNNAPPTSSATVGFIGALSNTDNQSFPVSATTTYTYRDVFGN